MSDQPGEFVGRGDLPWRVDGIKASGPGAVYTIICADNPDFPAAANAAVALAEEQRDGPWVPLSDYVQITRNGKRVRSRASAGAPWEPSVLDYNVLVSGYRAALKAWGVGE